MATNCVTIKYNNDSCLCPLPAPTSTIKDFILQLKDELNIDATISVIMSYQNNRLLPSGTIQSYGIQRGCVLELTTTTSQTLLQIRIQTLAGEQLCYSMQHNATLQDLFDVINKDQNVSFTTTFPILFNHRMHLCPSNELLTDYLKLHGNINWNIDAVPHFYLFECKRQLETHHLEYDKSSKNEMFLATDNWQPLTCVQQTDTAMSIYLITLRILSNVFLSYSEVETDSICANHLPQFLIVLRRFLFPPACLAFYHLIEGGLFQFEKQLISEAFFRLFREMLPTSVADSDVFLYTPQIFYNIFENAQHASTERDSYQLVDLIKPVCDSANGTTSTHFIKPVYQLGRSNDNLVLSELADVEKENKIANVDYIRQSDLIALLEWMKKKSVNSNPSEKYFKEYRLWLPPTDKAMFSLANIFEQRSKIIRLGEPELKMITGNMSTTDVYSKLTFIKPSTVSKINHDQFALLVNQHVVYLDRAEKADKHTFLSFDPLNPTTTKFNISEIAADKLLLLYPSFAVRETPDDARRIEQVTVVLFDVSASMKNTIVGSNPAHQHNLLDLSVIALGAWSDKLISYRFPQAVGLIYFGAAMNTSNPTSVSSSLWSHILNAQKGHIEEACSITRNFSRFETALGRRPECGGSTPLYDAIITATEAIATFREQYKTKLNADCRQLILCLSDGENNCGTATLDMVKTRLQTEKIIFDCVSFTEHEVKTLVDLCVSTKGYYHLNVPHDKEAMTNLFELEATISVHGRDERLVGKIEKPKRRPPVELHYPAITLKEARMSSGQVTNRSLRSVTRELSSLKTNPLDNFIVFVSIENLFFWKVILIGPSGTSYASYHWLLTLEFTSDYPIQPPEIRFITPIYHCNINDDGRICHEILRGQWTQKTTIRDVLIQILDLLSDPNPQDALSTSKGAQYAASVQNYQNEILEWKRKYASQTVEALMTEYNLE